MDLNLGQLVVGPSSVANAFSFICFLVSPDS
jgi:hypothetical protein